MKITIKKIPTNLIIFGFFLILAVSIYLPAFSGKIISGQDTPKITYPFLKLIDESFKQRSLILWTPDIFFGYPIGSEQGQYGIFYPFNLLHLFLPLTMALLINSLIHLSAAGFFTYLFIKSKKIGVLPSILAGIIFIFGGFIVAHLQYPSHVYAYPYLPLVILIADRAIKKNSLFLSSLVGFLIGLQFLTGHPNIPIMTLIATLLYYLLNCLKNPRQLLVHTLAFGVILSFTSLPLTTPLTKLLPLSTRAHGVDFTDATNSSLNLSDTVTFFFPNFFFKDTGNWYFNPTWHVNGYWGQIETIGFVGIATIILSIVSTLRKDRKKFAYFYLLLIISLVIAFGKNTPFYKMFLFKLPIINGLRAPARFLMLTNFSLAVLAALGLDAIRKSKRKHQSSFILTILTTALIPLVIVALLLLNNLQPNSSVNQLFFRYYYRDPDFISNLTSSLTRQTSTGLVFLALSTLVITLVLKSRRSLKRFFTKLVLVTTMVELFVFASSVHLFFTENELLAINSPDLNSLKSTIDSARGRVYVFRDFWSDLMADRLLPYHLPDGNGFVSLPLSRFDRWQKEAERRWQNGDPSFFQLGSITTVYEKAGQPQFTPIKDSLPRAYAVNDWQTVNDESESFQLLTSTNFNFQNSVIIEGSQPDDKENHPGLIPADIIYYSPHRVEIKAHTETKAVLVLTDTFYPGWKAYVNGLPTTIYPANHLFRAISLTPGRHQVVFQYQPTSFKIALLTLILTPGLLGFLYFKKRDEI